jgi:hypothetical protein
VLNLYGDAAYTVHAKRLAWRGIGERHGHAHRISAHLGDFDLFCHRRRTGFEQGCCWTTSAAERGRDKAAVRMVRLFMHRGGFQMMDITMRRLRPALEFSGLLISLPWVRGTDDRQLRLPSWARIPRRTVVGFENHSGKTFLADGVTPLGKVLKGYGNNGEDGRWV